MEKNLNRFNSFQFVIWALSSLFIIASCDKIEGPYMEPGNNGVDSSSGAVRKVLIEDFTGHTCGNCPRAAEAAETLKQLYGEKIVVVAAHVGFFAQPESNPDSSYAYDFRTTMGNELDAAFNIDAIGLPKGTVNRTEVNGNLLLAYAAWGPAVQEQMLLAPDLEIGITNNYNAAGRTVIASVNTEFLNATTGVFNLVVLLTEDSIINWQKDYNLPVGQQNIPDYTHRHVLRSSLNGTWGEEIAAGAVSAGYSKGKAYALTLPDEWDEGRCSIAAYVYETGSNEVIQVEETKVK